MILVPLGSGSNGNCYYVENDQEALLIDAGLSARQIKFRLNSAGFSGEKIRSVLLTHEHTDHIKGVEIFTGNSDIKVYGTGGTLVQLNAKRKTKKNLLLEQIHTGQSFLTDGFEVTPFAVSHDAKEPCGYTIKSSDLRLCCCTDTGIITDRMEEYIRRCDMIILESNHCPEMLEKGPYPYYLKKRIMDIRGHLSNEDAGELLKAVKDHLHFVLLAHLSKENNTPEKAFETARNGLGDKSMDMVVDIAQQDYNGGDLPPCYML